MNRILGAAAIFGAALLVATPSFAQTSVSCRAQGTEAERIACLEARIEALEEALMRQQAVDAETPATSSAEQAPVVAPPVDPADDFGAEQLDAAPAVAAAAPAAREGRRWLRMPNIPFFGDDDEDEDDAPATAAAAAAPPPAPPSSADPEAFGAEQVAANTNTGGERRRESDEDILRATIIDFQELHRGRLVVALDNGQMWRQMDVDTRQVRLREGETYPVEISRSGFGGYRMKIADNNRIFTVERLR